MIIFDKNREMKDTIEIKQQRIIANLSFTITKKDKSYIGYIPSFDIPFTSPSEDKATEIANRLVNSLLKKWLKDGDLKFFTEKLEKHKFSLVNLSENRFELSTPTKSFKIRQELDVV